MTNHETYPKRAQIRIFQAWHGAKELCYLVPARGEYGFQLGSLSSLRGRDHTESNVELSWVDHERFYVAVIVPKDINKGAIELPLMDLLSHGLSSISFSWTHTIRCFTRGFVIYTPYPRVWRMERHTAEIRGLDGYATRVGEATGMDRK